MKKSSNTNWKFQTKAVHAGEAPDPATGASAPNLVMSSTYVVPANLPFSAEGLNDEMPHIYTRWSNPTVAQLESKLAVLEGGEAALCFASGMAAATGLFTQLLKQGDHLLISDVTYAGVREYANEILPGFGVQVSPVDMSNLTDVKEALRDNTKLV